MNGTNSLIDRLEKQLRDTYAGVMGRRYDFRRLAGEFLSEDRAAEQLDQVKQFAPFDLNGRRLLEVGSGYGVFPFVAHRRMGIEAWGVEPAPKDFFGAIDLCRDFYLSKGDSAPIISGEGENLPFIDKAFDVVCSFNALEHTKNPERVLDEIVRVLAPGGFAALVIPNYGSWWEGHFGLLWYPNLPKWLAKLYVGLIGRDANYMDSIHFLNVPRILNALQKHEHAITVATTGKEIWVRRLMTLDFSEWASLGKLKRVVRAIHRLRLHHVVARIGGALNWHTPIVLVFRKNVST